LVTVERQAIVPYSAGRMFALVEDIESYPLFLPWCSRTEVVERTADRAVATIHVDFRGVRQTFTTANRMQPGERIRMTLVRGPFKVLTGEWRFKALSASGCRVELTLAYQLASPLLARVVGPVFDHIANTFVDAFARRADALHAAP
jgi:ribosome-associated toxin RatA of RatAB toxin-antitoxin module